MRVCNIMRSSIIIVCTLAIFPYVSTVCADELLEDLAELKELLGLLSNIEIQENVDIKVQRNTKHKRLNKLDRVIYIAAKEAGISSVILRAIIKAESDYNQYAISPKGAKGYCQLMPQTARALGVRNIFNLSENIRAGALYYRMMYDRFRGNRVKALYAYNAGPIAVETNRIPLESQRYAEKVMQHYHRYLKKYEK